MYFFGQSKQVWLYEADNYFAKSDYASALKFYKKAQDDSLGLAITIVPYEVEITNQKIKKEQAIKIDSTKEVSIEDYLNHQIATCYFRTFDYNHASDHFLKTIDSKCIIFANTQKQADRICSHSYHSKNDQSDYNLELFNDGRINKLSCVSQLNEGISISNLSEGIIMHSYGNERKTAQRIGRLLRLNPNDVATCHILCYANTVDERWVDSALKSFDKTKIKYKK